jgi:RNA polymerase sigma factor (sigma-70 family)
MSENDATLGYVPSDPPASRPDEATPCPGRSLPIDGSRHDAPGTDLKISLSRVRASAYNVTRNASAADDIAQTIYARLLELPREDRDALDSLEAVAVRAARNEALNWRRTAHRDASINDAGDVADERSDPAVRVSNQDEVRHLLAKLPPRLRVPFMLCKMYGYYAEEAAAELGISVEVVWKRVQRAFDILRRDEPKTHPRRSRIHRLFNRKEP